MFTQSLKQLFPVGIRAEPFDDLYFRLQTVGAQLHRRHGGKDPEVGERAQTVPGVGSRGAQLLAAALQRAGGPSQGRLQLGALLQDPQPALGRVGWVPLCVAFFGLFLLFVALAPVGRRNQSRRCRLCEWRPLFPMEGDSHPPPDSTHNIPHNTPHSHVHWVEAKPTEICYYGVFPPSPN